jgi:hypothetical protein
MRALLLIGQVALALTESEDHNYKTCSSCLWQNYDLKVWCKGAQKCL